jgi:hypothetical protein
MQAFLAALLAPCHAWLKTQPEHPAQPQQQRTWHCWLCSHATEHTPGTPPLSSVCRLVLSSDGDPSSVSWAEARGRQLAAAGGSHLPAATQPPAPGPSHGPHKQGNHRLVMVHKFVKKETQDDLEPSPLVLLLAEALLLLPLLLLLLAGDCKYPGIRPAPVMLAAASTCCAKRLSPIMLRNHTPAGIRPPGAWNSTSNKKIIPSAGYYCCCCTASQVPRRDCRGTRHKLHLVHYHTTHKSSLNWCWGHHHLPGAPH